MGLSGWSSWIARRFSLLASKLEAYLDLALKKVSLASFAGKLRVVFITCLEV